jgi:hypothetical protein
VAVVFAFVIGAGNGAVLSGNKGTVSSLTAERDALKTANDALEAQVSQLQASGAGQSSASQPDDSGSQSDAAADTAPASTSGTYSDGTYLVGTDMPAGRYKGRPTSDSGYWKISSDANGSNIVENNNVSGQFYVSVKRGQYLELDSVEIAKVK